MAKQTKEELEEAEKQLEREAGLTHTSKSSLVHFENERGFTFKKLGGFLKVVLINIKKHPWIFFGMLISVIANGILATLLPKIGTELANNIISAGQSTNGLPTQGIAFLGMYMHWYSWIFVLIFALFFAFIFEFLTDYLIGLFAMKVEVQQRLEILDKLVDQDIDFFFTHATGNILTRFVADTQGLALGIQMFVSNIFYAMSTVISAIVVLFLSVPNAALPGIALAYTVFFCLTGFVIFVFFRRAMIRMFDIKREIDANMTDRIENITLIKSSGQELQEIKRNENQNAVYNRAGNSTVFLQVCLSTWIFIGNNFLPIVMFLITMAMESKTNPNWLTEAVTLLGNVTMVSAPIVMLIQTLRAATRASNSADRIAQLTGPVPSIKPNWKGYKVKKIENIIFDKVAFAYPSDPKNIIIPPTDFKFEKGKSYAFVGETGSGKSTIGRMLLRMYDPISGKVLINGTHDLKTINLPEYLKHVGYVEQNPQLFYGNFWENISYGMFKATHEQIIAAAKKANLHDFIMTLPDGYDTILGERGFLLSGGQKQRLVIARIFLKDPDLIILDEATSALDNIVEKEIQVELDKLVKGKTSVTIAHRLSTIKNVDEVIVISPKKGITQRGTFDELKKVPGHFKDLYDAGLMD